MKKKLISVLATGLFFLGMVGAAQAVVVQPTYYFSFEGVILH